MYTQQDFIDVKNTAVRRVLMMLLLSALFLAGVIVLTALRQEIPQLIVAMIGYVVVYFLWSFKVTPWMRYAHFMKDMNEGQRRELECEYVGMDGETRLADGVEVYEFHTRVGKREEDERLFLFDSNKPVPELTAGEKLKIVSFGNHIISIDKIGKDNSYKTDLL